MPNPNPKPRPISRRPDGRPTLPAGMSYRRNGTIRYRYTEHGRRIDLYAPTAEEALRKRFEPKPDPGSVTIDETTTLADYLRVWVAGLGLRSNSVGTHEGHVRNHLIPLFGEEVRLAAVTRELVKVRLVELRARRSRYGTPLAPQTVALIYATLRLALNAAMDDGRIPSNPAMRHRPNGTTGSKARGARVGLEARIPTELEIKRMGKALEGDPLEALFRLTAMTGLRQSEVLGLSWADVEAGAPTHIRVSQGLRRTDRVLDDTKNASSARFVPIGPAARTLLREHRILHPGPGLVFRKPDGSPLVGSTISHWFTHHAKALELPYTFHDLRHAYASRLINAGVSIAIVSKLLGHADVTITSRTYHHLLRTDETGTAAIAEAALG
jgi:integrase